MVLKTCSQKGKAWSMSNSTSVQSGLQGGLQSGLHRGCKAATGGGSHLNQTGSQPV
jgi:hypothetical protein